MVLTPEQQAKREGKVTASFLPALMAGYDDDIFDKWLELIGDPSWRPKKPTWPMAWGSYGEPFILDWHASETEKPFTRRGEVVDHPTKPHVACTLDAYRAFDDCVFDAKVCQAFTPIDEIIAFYTPQLIVQRTCLQCARAALLVVHGSSKPVEYEIVVDPAYEAIVWERIEQFWTCVQDLMQPVVFPRVTPPEQWRTIDINRIECDAHGIPLDAKAWPNWIPQMRDMLEAWDRCKDKADEFEAVVKEIKTVLPEDVGKLVSNGVMIRRARNRAVTIKRMKADDGRAEQQ